MNAKQSTTDWLSKEPYDFSLSLGGPFYQLYRKVHLCTPALELLRRRVLIITLFAWLPLLVLSVLEGRAWGGAVQVPFLLDVHAHARFLVALPLFIVAEIFVHQRIRQVVRQFIECKLVSDTERTKFDAILASAIRLRNSWVAELMLLAFVYLVGVLVIWRSHAALNVSTWYALPVNGSHHPTLAGWWLLAVSLPLFQFIWLRWYYRLFIWARFLWQVAWLDLRLVPTHPDKAGGLGFLSLAPVAFAPLLVGQGAVLAGWMADHIFFEGATLLQFKFEILIAVALLLLFVLGPLLAFVPLLAQARRVGIHEYGSLASRYVREFDHKWVHGNTVPREPLLGTQDMQSLADLGNSLDRVHGMRLVPFGKETLLRLTLMIVLPVLPLSLTMISLDQLLSQLLKVVF